MHKFMAPSCGSQLWQQQRSRVRMFGGRTIATKLMLRRAGCNMLWLTLSPHVFYDFGIKGHLFIVIKQLEIVAITTIELLSDGVVHRHLFNKS